MIVLGLAQVSPHDPSAALLVDGRVVACAEQERFSRRKHANEEKAADAAVACLRTAGITIEDVDLIAVPHSHENVRKLRMACFRRSWGRSRQRALRTLRKRDKLREDIFAGVDRCVTAAGGRAGSIPVQRVEHHFAHAASAFFFSGMQSSALLTVDGVGECTTTLFGDADRSSGLRSTLEIPRPDSLGSFYSSITEYLGFLALDGEYKVMGMAPYGDPERIDLRDVLSYSNGDFRLNLDYVNAPRDLRYDRKSFSRSFVDRFGPPRQGDALEEPYIHIAAAAQKRLEDIVLHLIEYHLGETLARHEGRLCFAGGCALNVRLNRKIIEHPLVDRLYVPPAAGDSGLSIGAAAFAAHEQGDEVEEMVHAYHGPAFDQDEIDAALGSSDLPCQRVDDPARTAAELLNAGHVLAWFQGRMEWGPRALGNRSILGNPTVQGTAKQINEQIKFREVWRPFCPSILEEFAHDVVDGEHDSPFMTYSFRVKEPWKLKAPEIVHVDGTARPQFVSKATNPAFHALISHFHERTGCPLVINTSLNRRGEPMVCSPQDAVGMFLGSGLTHMVIGHTLVTKPA